MRARASLDFAALARPVALALLGEPNPRASTAQELRYGRKGSLQVTIAGEWAGRWYDFEAGTTGGVLRLGGPRTRRRPGGGGPMARIARFRRLPESTREQF